MDRQNFGERQPNKDIDYSRFKLCGAVRCLVRESSVWKGRVSIPKRIKCYFNEKGISAQELMEVAQRAAPDLHWTSKGTGPGLGPALDFAWGDDIHECQKLPLGSANRSQQTRRS